MNLRERVLAAKAAYEADLVSLPPAMQRCLNAHMHMIDEGIKLSILLGEKIRVLEEKVAEIEASEEDEDEDDSYEGPDA